MQNKEWGQSQHGIWEKAGARRRVSWKCWNSCWMECDFPILSWANWCHVWSRRHHRGSTCFRWCQNTLQQHRWNDCYDWSLVFSWSSWSSHPWWAVVFLLRFYACCWYLFGHNPSSYTLARQQSLIRAQRRLRLTMQHVYGHSGKLGNECADHAAAFGTFGLISNHNVATRWVHHNFDASVCCNGCDNISEVLERLQHFRTNVTSFHQDRGLALVFLIGSTMFFCAFHVT